MRGPWYATGVVLRQEAARAMEAYPGERERSQTAGLQHQRQAHAAHADALIFRAVGLEFAAALYCVAQAIEDSRSA